MVARSLVWPGILLGTLGLAGLLLQPCGPDLAMIVAGLVSAVVISLAERALPFEPQWNANDGEIGTDAVFVVILALVDDSVRSLIAAVFARWLYTNNSSAYGLFWEQQAIWVTVPAALVVGELGGWFSHWALHVRRWPLWPLHRVHHAVGRLYLLNTYRFHPLDLAMQLLCIYPLLYLAGLASPAVLFWYSVFFNTVGQLSHSNIDTRCGVLNFVFNTPEAHRYHHDRSIKVANSNYGQVLLIFDILFGTFHRVGARPRIVIGDKLLSGSGVVQNLTRPIKDIVLRLFPTKLQ